MPTVSDRSFRARLTAHASSSGGIYGLVLVAGMIVVSRDLDTNRSAPLTVALTLLVFFVAHLYATTVAHFSGSRSTLRQALGHVHVPASSRTSCPGVVEDVVSGGEPSVIEGRDRLAGVPDSN